MALRPMSAGLLLLAQASVAGSSSAQPIPAPTPKPGIVVTPAAPTTAARDQVSWEDPARHVKVVAVYDGRRVRVLSATSGEGSARSYLSQRSDIVVLVLNQAKERLRQFNLADPREVRIREQPAVLDARAAALPRVPPEPEVAHEWTTRRRSAQFDLFVPHLEGAQWIEFRAGEPAGRLLGRVDLSAVR